MILWCTFWCSQLGFVPFGSSQPIEKGRTRRVRVWFVLFSIDACFGGLEPSLRREPRNSWRLPIQYGSPFAVSGQKPFNVSRLPHHKRNLFCLPRQKGLFLAFWKKSGIYSYIGLPDGGSAVRKPVFSFQAAKTIRNAGVFCVSLLCKELKKTRGRWI